MKPMSLPNRAIALPLVGLILVWVFAMASQFVGMTVEIDQSATRPSAAVMLLGLLVAGFASLIGRGWAIRAETDNPSDLARAAVRFGNLAMVLSLGALTFFAIGIFMSGFNDYNRVGTVGDRFVWLYLPIILATAAVIFLLLRAFVFGQGNSHTEGEEKPRMSERQRALALGYAVPILSTAFAIILGLFIYDATRTNLQTWVWVIIIAIVGFGVIAGTRFAAKARAARTEAPKPKTALATGAATLNFVLSVVFGATVSILAFTLGSEAMNKLQMMPVMPMDFKPSVAVIYDNLNWQWFVNDMLPAAILIKLAAFGIYLSITERNRARQA